MNAPKTDAGKYNFLAGGGEMGGRIRAFDWSPTPLGSLADWPQSLKTSVGLMLNSQHPMWIGWGPDITFLYNDAYIEVLSRAKHPLALGRSAADVWREIWDFCGPLADKVFQRGEASFVNDVRLFMNRGDFVEETFYSFSYSPIRDESGNVGGLFCPSAEVTAKILNTRRLRTLSDLAADSLVQKSTEAACASAAAILSRNRDDIPFSLIYLLDADGRLARLEQTSGLEKGVGAVSPVTVPLEGNGPDASPWRLAEIVRDVQSHLVTLDGEKGLPLGAADQPITAALVLPVISRGQERPLGILIAGVNPTRKLDLEYRAFYELIASHLATAIQNARATEQEKKRADMLAELDRAKTTFFSNISHELRTPLTLILGPLEDEMRASPVPREGLQLAHRNSLRLLKLVNTLLDFSRIEAGRMEASFEPTDLAAYTAELASVFRSGMERAGLRLIVDCPPFSEPAYVDRDMWEKIVFNLLSNAFKFTAEGEIEVKLREVTEGRPEDYGNASRPAARSFPGAGHSLLLSVRDTGTGIPAAELRRVFERFHRVRNSWSRSHEGTGIGLALVQELTRQHGGAVTVESAEGQGTTFLVQIPLGRAHLPKDRISAGRTLASTSDGSAPYVEEALRWLPHAVVNGSSGVAADGKPGQCIVLAEDNADMREYVRRLLVGAHYEVVEAGDGHAALAAVRNQRPALVLSDVMMPGLDGFGLLAELRADPATRTIPIVLMSARAGEESRVEGMEAGADDYLAKPFSARELLARVSTHLKLARMREEADEALRLAHRRLQTVLSSITDGLAVLDKQWRYSFFSEQAGRIFGLRPEQLLGQNVWDLFPQAKGTKFFEGYHRAVDTGEAVHFEEYYPEPINKWLACHCYPSAEGLAIYFHDITDRKQAEKALADSERLLRTIYDGTHEYIGLLTTDGTLIEANRASLSFANSRREDVINRPFWDTVWFQYTTGAPTLVRDAVVRAAAGERIQFEAPLLTPTGEWKTYDISFDPIYDEQGKVILIVPEGRDITERKRHEKNLAFLAEMQKVLAPLASTTLLMQESAARVAQHLNLSHCLLVEINDTADIANVLHDHPSAGTPSLVGVYPISAFHTDEERGAMAAGNTLVINNVRHDPRSAARAEQFLALGVESMVNAPYVANRQWRFVLSAIRSEPRAWRADEVELLTELAARIYVRLERARAEERLRESEDRFRSVFEHAATGIAITTITGRFERCNPAYCTLLGYTEKELQTMRFSALIHPADVEKNMADIKRLQAEELPYFEIENRYVCKDGTALWVRKFVSLLRDEAGQPAHVVALVTNVTERRRTEAALQEAKEAAEAANSSKDRFLAALSHELRTPLTPVLMTAATLQEDERLPMETREQLGMIERNISLEARLIDDLLDITAIARGKLHLRTQPCDAHSLINLALEIVRDEALTKEIAIERRFIAVHSGLVADPARFQQVVWNLLRNAIKFTSRGGRVSIQTTEETDNAGALWLRLEVSDSGIGIEENALEKIFRPFEQAAVTGDHRFGGLGLGLAIARAIVDLHGGRIRADSDGPGRGATFVVELPGAISPPHGVVDGNVAAGPSEKGGGLSSKPAGKIRRLLLVEDHAATLQVISTLLSRSGYQVVAATNVADGLRAAAVDKFDLVVSDLGLPDGTGIQLMEKLRALHGLRGVALTGYGMESDIARAREAGFVAHIVKPVHIAELRRILSSLG